MTSPKLFVLLLTLFVVAEIQTVTSEQHQSLGSNKHSRANHHHKHEARLNNHPKKHLPPPSLTSEILAEVTRKHKVGHEPSPSVVTEVTHHHKAGHQPSPSVDAEVTHHHQVGHQPSPSVVRRHHRVPHQSQAVLAVTQTNHRAHRRRHHRSPIPSPNQNFANCEISELRYITTSISFNPPQPIVTGSNQIIALAGNPYSHVGSTNFCLFRQGSLRNPIQLRVELSLQWLVS